MLQDKLEDFVARITISLIIHPSLLQQNLHYKPLEPQFLQIKKKETITIP
mgnify:CR=1 FL=1